MKEYIHKEINLPLKYMICSSLTCYMIHEDEGVEAL
jgi:hypothetical protein